MTEGNDSTVDRETVIGWLVDASPEDESSWRLHYPKSWHGGPSRAESVLAPFGISARRFVDASPEEREELVESIRSGEVRQLLGRASLYAVIVVAFVLTLGDIWLLAASGGVAIKAGADLGRFSARMRCLRDSLHLSVSDLEVERPEADTD